MKGGGIWNFSKNSSDLLVGPFHKGDLQKLRRKIAHNFQQKKGQKGLKLACFDQKKAVLAELFLGEIGE